MTTLSFYHNANSNFIKISGKDSANFIQGLITKDINSCNDKNLIYACMLTPQGKFLADFFIFKKNDAYFFEIHEKFYENFFNKLIMYKLRSIVNIEKIDSLNSFVIFGEVDINNNYEIFNLDPRNINIGKKLIQKNSTIDNELNFNEIDELEYHEILIKNKVPYSPFDLEINKSLLLENKFEEINAISWDKGCYVGQEITARMKYRALLKKQTYVLELVAGKLEVGEDIFINKINLGKVISVSNKYVLCMLKINLIDEQIVKNNTFKIDSSSILKLL